MRAVTDTNFRRFIMKKQALKFMPYAQAKVIENNGTITLVSYNTTVISVNLQGWLTCYGLYSQTTRRHIGAFMKEYGNSDYSTAKFCYEKNYRFNIYTGEIEDL